MMDILNSIHSVEIVRDVREIRNRKKYFDRIDTSNILTDTEFKNRYRFTKNGVEFLENLLGLELSTLNICQRGKPISPKIQILCALRVFAKGTYQSESADLHGVSQPTLSRILKKVSIALCNKKNRFITFPSTIGEQRKEVMAFQEISGFPSVIGCIGGTHIPIINPGGPDAPSFLNRKGFHSLNIQVICGADLKILNIVARWRGSADNAKIFDESAIKRKFENGHFQGMVLLGDNAYPCSNYLLTPVLNPQSRKEEAYNYAHIRTRNTIEHCFGFWKTRFRALHRRLTTNLDNSKAMIVAMAVLHNISILINELELPDEEKLISDSFVDTDDQNVTNTRGSEFRANFINRHFSN